MVYWKGGDKLVEDKLFSTRYCDRVVVWGTPDTVESVVPRISYIKTLFLNPRYGVSIIGKGAFPNQLAEAAARGVIDSLIANQYACNSSLIHYVEGSKKQILAYCRLLKKMLARWDKRYAHKPAAYTYGQLRMLRRHEWLKAKWFINQADEMISSAVVYLQTEFDMAKHPLNRCIVVRRLNKITDVMQYITKAVSTAGIYPFAAIDSLQDRLAACGVSNILPLGEAEKAYPGMPHDGIKIMSELVNWTNSYKPC